MIFVQCYYKSSIKSEKIKNPVNLINKNYQYFDYGQKLVVVSVDVDVILNYIFVAVVLLNCWCCYFCCNYSNLL